MTAPGGHRYCIPHTKMSYEEIAEARKEIDMIFAIKLAAVAEKKIA